MILSEVDCIYIYIYNIYNIYIYIIYFVSVSNYGEDTMVFHGNSTAPVVSALVSTVSMNVSVDFIQSDTSVNPNYNYHHIKFNRAATRNITSNR